MYIWVSKNTYTYLLLSEAEIELILSTFQVQITCFQSINEGSSQTRKEIEMEIINNNDSLMANNFEVCNSDFFSVLVFLIANHAICCKQS